MFDTVKAKDVYKELFKEQNRFIAYVDGTNKVNKSVMMFENVAMKDEFMEKATAAINDWILSASIINRRRGIITGLVVGIGVSVITVSVVEYIKYNKRKNAKTESGN